MKPDATPAFPVSHPHATPYPGMTLRDWFAGQALQAIVAMNTDASYLSDAGTAYAYADAMIEARKS